MVQIRTPDQRLRIFVSSSMRELAEERAAVRQAIQRLHLTPVLFDQGARPYPPRDLYLAYLNQSDVFIGIYGDSYGWVAPGSEVSGLEDEYFAAAGRPRLVYVRTPAPDRDRRLAEMLKRVEQSGVSYHTFHEPGDLADLISDDLALLVSDRFGGRGQPSPPATPEAVHKIGRDAPGAANRFIGRREELAEVIGLVTDSGNRLVTLIGAGGIGKSRLAMQAAASAAASFDGIAVAELDQIAAARTPIMSAIASALGVPESTGSSLLDSVVGYVGSRHLLLVLDDFEHLLESAPLIAELIARTAWMTVLVTSRERLHLTGEHVFEVPPMALPGPSEDPEASRRSDSVELFTDRAAAAGATLRLDDHEIQAVIEICKRLDSLPLAIELAASRARTLELDELNRMLDTGLGLLTGGASDLPPRQQTLRAAIGWSVDLLSEVDRRLFARLGVFSGSFALEAAQTVCDTDALALFDGISSLVDKALLRPDHSVHGQPRFAMLSVIREYAGDELASAGERDRLRQAHADYYRGLVLDGARRLRMGDMRTAINQHVADQANISAALQWFIETRESVAVAEFGLACWPVWFSLGRYAEGQQAMERAVAADLALTEHDRASVMLALGMMLFERGDYARAPDILEQALWRYTERGDLHHAATASVALGVIAGLRGEDEGLRQLSGAVEDVRGLDDRWTLGYALLALGSTLIARDRDTEAIGPLEESAAISRDGDDMALLSNALIGLGKVHLRRNDAAEAQRQLEASLELAIGLANRETIARALDTFAASAAQVDDAAAGATLLGAADGIRRSVGADVWAIDRASHDDTRERLEAALGARSYGRLADEGAALSMDEVLDMAAPRRTH
jgi:predicted ATPase